MSKKLETEVEKLDKQRLARLSWAEWVDAWRVVPRLMVSLYVFMVGAIVMWFMDLPTYVQRHCDNDLLLKLVESQLSPEAIERLACQITGIIGGPTTTTTIFITTICGLATGIFAFYANTGRDWSQGVHLWYKKKKGTGLATKEAMNDEE